MTIDEVISIMNVIVHMLEPQYDTDRIEDAVEMAIKALEQEPCGDCISREAVENAIKHAEVNFTVNSDIDFTKHIREVHEIVNGIVDAQIKALRDLPFVTPQPKMGKWEKRDVRGQRVDCCSVCGLSNGTIYEYNYCPNCGAKMQEVEE